MIYAAITENTTLTDVLKFEKFRGKIVINVEPNSSIIKDVEFGDIHFRTEKKEK